MWQNNNTRLMAKWVILGLALLLIVLPLAACGGNNNESSEGESSEEARYDSVAGQIDADSIVASYEGGQITGKQLIAFLGAHKFFNLSEYYAFYEMSPGYLEDMLHQLIAIHLITDEADEQVKKESADQAKTDIKELEKSIDASEENQAQFKEFMEIERIKLADLEAYMSMRYTLQKQFMAKYSDEVIQAKFEELLSTNKDQFTIATVRHILVGLEDAEGNERSEEDALKRAQEVAAKLKNGGDWNALASEYSDDPGSKDNGGQYEDVEVAMWVENFKKHAVELPVGEISDPFLTDFGYHVMVVEKRSQQSFEEVKDQVQGQLISDYFTDLIMVQVPAMITELNLPVQEEETAETGEETTE